MTDYYFPAIAEGVQSFEDGLSIKDNPYKYDSVGANKAGWDRGWNEALVDKQEQERKEALRNKSISKLIEYELPDFAEMVKGSQGQNAVMSIKYADFSGIKLKTLGALIKYAALKGVTLTIVSNN